MLYTGRCGFRPYIRGIPLHLSTAVKDSELMVGRAKRQLQGFMMSDADSHDPSHDLVTSRLQALYNARLFDLKKDTGK